MTVQHLAEVAHSLGLSDAEIARIVRSHRSPSTEKTARSAA